ncbi:unnamed protein product [Prunus brigantina]
MKSRNGTSFTCEISISLCMWNGMSSELTYIDTVWVWSKIQVEVGVKQLHGGGTELRGQGRIQLQVKAKPNSKSRWKLNCEVKAEPNSEVKAKPNSNSRRNPTPSRS